MSIFHKQKQENTIIVGCGILGVHLASLLNAQKDFISIIDIKGQAFSKLSDASSYCLVEGDATDLDILECAGIKTADRVIITTNDDNTNIMIAQIARKYYKVHQVIVKVEDTSKECTCSHMGIIVVNPLILMLEQFRQVLADENEG